MKRTLFGTERPPEIPGVDTGKVGLNSEQPFAEVIPMRGGAPKGLNRVLWRQQVENLSQCLAMCRHDIWVRDGIDTCGAVMYQRKRPDPKDKTGKKYIRPQCIAVADLSHIKTNSKKQKEAWRFVYTTIDKHPNHFSEGCGNDGDCCGPANGDRKFSCGRGYKKSMVQVPGSAPSRCTDSFDFEEADAFGNPVPK